MGYHLQMTLLFTIILIKKFKFKPKRYLHISTSYQQHQISDTFGKKDPGKGQKITKNPIISIFYTICCIWITRNWTKKHNIWYMIENEQFGKGVILPNCQILHLYHIKRNNPRKTALGVRVNITCSAINYTKRLMDIIDISINHN